MNPEQIMAERDKYRDELATLQIDYAKLVAAKARNEAALIEAVESFVALDRTFVTATDAQLAELIAEQRQSAPVARAVQKARAAIAMVRS